MTTGGINRSMTAPRLILFAARWAIMSGLAGTVFAVLVFTDEQRARTGDNGLLFAAAVLLAIAFILAPFVRNAYVGALREKPARSKHKTLLDEMREGETIEATPDVANENPKPGSVLVSRLLIALYAVFGAMLVAVVLSMS